GACGGCGAGPRSAGVEVERRVQDLDGVFHLGLLDHAGDADGRGGDHLDVDVVVGQDLEHLGRHPRVGLHAGTDDRDPADVVVEPHAGVVEVPGQRVDERGGPLRVGVRDGEGDVRAAVLGHVLDDQVDVDAGVGEGREHL